MKSLLKTLSLVVCFFMAASVNVFAGSKTFYFKASATSSEEVGGSVYVSFGSAAPAEGAYVSTMTTEVFSKSQSQFIGTPSSTSTTLYLYAKAKGKYKFVGWFDNAEMTGDPLSTESTYKPSVTSKKATNTDPATFEYYAKFVEATEFYSSIFTVSCVGEGGSVSVSTESGSEDFGTEKSASNLNDVEAKCKYYLQAKPVDAEVYRFLGWYSDEACEIQLSKNANYTYNVDAESTDETAPSQFKAYAKFEKIPYFYSVVKASALGEGKVNVSASNTAGEYAANSEYLQKIADKAEHTYYLNAQAEGDETEFDGWFSDAECTNKLSGATAYTYKVSSTSQEEASATTFNVYAKFTSRDMYQVRNAGFEKWAANNEPGFGWNSFPSATGDQAGLGKGLSPNPSKVEGRNGGSAVRLYSKYAGVFGIGANANGNLTTGTVNMGSMTPADASNHNYTDTETKGHYLVIAGQPDGVEFYSKYKKGQTGDYCGHAQFIIHDKYNYCDPETDEELEHKIGSCGVDINESAEWVRNTGDFSYIWEKDAAAATTKYLLINFTTNAVPGGSKDDELILDDVRLIYNSELATAEYDGDELTFTDGAATCDALYDESKLTLTSNGRAATIVTSYDDATAVLTITVKGENISSEADNYHTYTIQFKASADPSKLTFTENLYVTVNGNTVGPQETDVIVEVLNEDFDFNFILKNFVLGEGTESIPVGNIRVNGMKLNPDYSFAFNGNIMIEAGDADGVGNWMGPLLGEIPLDLKGQLVDEDHMLVSIDIDMTATLQQIISVHLGYDAAMLAVSGAAKYATFCAPFEVTVPNGVTASTATVEDDVVVLAGLADGIIPANTPVILEAADDVALTVFGVAAPVSSPVYGCLTGVYADIDAPAGSYVLQNQEGKVGFYLVEDVQPVVKANRCYLTTAAGSQSRALYFGEDIVSALNAAVVAGEGNSSIYDLQGRRVAGAGQKGMLIVNGKKVIR